MRKSIQELLDELDKRLEHKETEYDLILKKIVNRKSEIKEKEKVSELPKEKEYAILPLNTKQKRMLSAREVKHCIQHDLLKEKKTSIKTRILTSKLKGKGILRKLKVYLTIVEYFNQGMTSTWIRDELNESKQTFYKKVRKLEGLKFLKHIGYGIYEVTLSGNNFLKQNYHRINLKVGCPLSIPLSLDKYTFRNSHAIKINIPLIEDNSKHEFWNEVDTLSYTNQWINKFKDVTFEKFSNKTIVINVKAFERESVKDFENRIYKIVFNSGVFLKENGVNVNLKEAKITYQEHTLKTKEIDSLENKVEKSKKFLTGFDRKKILPNDPTIKEKGWFDSTPYGFNYEGDGLSFEEAFGKMPYVIESLDKKLVPTLDKLTAQIELHLEVQRETKKMLENINKEFRTERKVKKIEKEMIEETKGIKPLEDVEDIVCPFCKSSFAKKLLLERDFLCPNKDCFRDLKLFFPDIGKT